MAAGKALKMAEGIYDRKNRNERFRRCGVGISLGDRGKGHPEHGGILNFSFYQNRNFSGLEIEKTAIEN